MYVQYQEVAQKPIWPRRVVDTVYVVRTDNNTSTQERVPSIMLCSYNKETLTHDGKLCNSCGVLALTSAAAAIAGWEVASWLASALGCIVVDLHQQLNNRFQTDRNLRLR